MSTAHDWEERAGGGGQGDPRIVRTGDVLMAEWPGIGRLTCNLRTSTSRFAAERGADPTLVAKLRAGAVPALLGDLRGGLSLHASAVATRSGAVLFMGAGGAGKSTAALELCLNHGGRLLSDDMTSLTFEGSTAFVVPTERAHHLTSASFRLLGLGPPTTRKKQKVPLRARRARSPASAIRTSCSRPPPAIAMC